MQPAFLGRPPARAVRHALAETFTADSVYTDDCGRESPDTSYVAEDWRPWAQFAPVPMSDAEVLAIRSRVPVDADYTPPPDVEEAWYSHGAAIHAQALEAAWASLVATEGRGLVRVLTTGDGQRSPVRAAREQARIEARRRRLQRRLGAIHSDAEKRRLTSLRATVGFAARAMEVQECGTRRCDAWMVTLTYRPGVDWQPEHISNAIRGFRHWSKRRGYPVHYIWIGELQDGTRRDDGGARQCIHYHLVLWLPKKVRPPYFDVRGWWPHGMTRRDFARSGAGYLIAYCKKTKSLKEMPHGARAYGVGGLDLAMRRARRWLRLPAMVRGNSGILDDFRPAIGGGWRTPDGGHMESEFRRINVAGRWCVQRIRTQPKSIDAAGPFSWLSDRYKFA